MNPDDVRILNNIDLAALERDETLRMVRQFLDSLYVKDNLNKKSTTEQEWDK